MDADDFEFQLAQEQREREAKEAAAKVKTRVDPEDGTEYEWNESLKAWFPKIDEDFIARYQSSYGNFEGNGSDSTPSATTSTPTTTTSTTDTGATQQPVDSSQSPATDPNGDDKKGKNKPFVSKLLKRKAEDQKSDEWFDVSDEHNTKVYVSGLPTDTTDDMFVELMKKCGYVARDGNGFKIKIYKDSNGEPKGDALCTYLKRESVELALNILDGYRVGDHEIHVERAKFVPKGQYDPSLKPKQRKRDKNKERKKIEKLLDWRPDTPIVSTERPKSDKTVIIKNMFSPQEFLREPKLILEYRRDLQDECGDRCGPVKRVDVYDCHPEGVAAIVFQEFAGADQCVQLMNGRFFAGRRLTAHLWDGRAKYKVDETEEEAEQRLRQWEEFLEREEQEAKE